MKKGGLSSGSMRTSPMSRAAGRDTNVIVMSDSGAGPLYSGVNINTLLARKRYAVRHLRARLQQIYDDFMKE